MADDTIGIELEFLNAGFTEFGEANHTGWKVETDGSVRHHAGRYTWIDDERFFPTRTEFGGEIISPILRFNNGIWRKIIPVMELLQDFGEVSKPQIVFTSILEFKEWVLRSCANFLVG